jgi:hypothetical protein
MAAVVIQMAPLRRGRKNKRDGREVFWLYPRTHADGRAWLYAVGFASGRTKIGIARNPRARITQHWVSADGAVAWTHLFCSVEAMHVRKVERVALDLAGAHATRIGDTETFTGLSRAAALQCVREAMASVRI